jgi:hypothetical protein
LWVNENINVYSLGLSIDTEEQQVYLSHKGHVYATRYVYKYRYITVPDARFAYLDPLAWVESRPDHCHAAAGSEAWLGELSPPAPVVTLQAV